MFPRIATVKRGDKTYKYLQIVEAYRVDGRTTQRVVGNLGRLDQLDGKLDDLLVAYKELDTVESGFRDLKDVIEMRPVHHQTDERIKAHIVVAALALFLKRSLEHQLASTLPEVSGSEAIAAMRSIGLAELSLNGQTTRLVSGGSRDARRVAGVLGITNLNPPVPAKGLPGAQEGPM